MADVRLKRKESLSSEEAAVWLHALSAAFAHGGQVELPMGGGTLGLALPDQVSAEFELEVDGDEVELEIEISWSTAKATVVEQPSAPPGT